MVVVFLFNLMCAIVPCDPIYNIPTSKPLLETSENSFLTAFRQGRVLNPEDSLSLARPPPIVQTEGGILEGYLMKVVSGREIYAFDGIPYAEAPAGARRFRAPVPKKPWRGVRQAKKAGHLCLQMHGGKLNRVLGNEDCLTVNVYTPQIPIQDYSPNMSVVVWFHGGSFFFGSGSEYGPAYLLKHDVVLVTVNYRLGVLGFLSTGDEENPGNWGLKDQSLAIKWVVDNIAQFGGNPKGITLMGQSAGAVAVHLHMMSNMTKNLFQRAVSMSGSGFVEWAVHTPHQARKWAEKLARFMRCPTSRGTRAMMNCFRTRDPNFLTANLYSLYDIIGFPPILLRPVIEPDLPGAFLTISPKEAYEQNQVVNIPFIATNTKEEAEFIRIVLTGFGVYRLFLRNWEVLAPTLLDYRRITEDRNTTAITHTIANFYFKGKDITKADGAALARVGSDRYFNSGNRKSLKYHSKIAPTYSYIFSYQNPYGFAAMFGFDRRKFGTSHSEDVAFLYNSSTYWESFKGHENGFAISKLIVSLFINFITKGEPLYSNPETGEDERIWEPVKDPENPMFLQIDEEVKMIPDPVKREIEFWESLGLNGSYPYEHA